MKALVLLCTLPLLWLVGCSSTGGPSLSAADRELSGQQFRNDIFSPTPVKLSDLKRFDQRGSEPAASQTKPKAKPKAKSKPRTKAKKSAKTKSAKPAAAKPAPVANGTELLFSPSLDAFPAPPPNPFAGDFWPIAVEIQSQFLAGGEVVSSPKVVTMPGQRASIEMMRQTTLPDGSKVPVGITFAVDPAIPEGLTPESPVQSFSPLPVNVTFHAKAIEEVGLAPREVNGEKIEHPYFSKHAMTKNLSLTPEQWTSVGTIRSEKPGNLPVVINLLAKWYVAGGE